MSSVDMYVDGAVASTCATLVSNPFDVMRTRMQLQGELRKRGEYHMEYRNMPQGMIRVVRQEGWKALFKGLPAAVLWQITQNGIRIGLYPAVRAELSHVVGSDAMYVSVVAGATCGMVGAFVSSPFQMVKTRLQSQRGTMTTLHGHNLSTATTGEQYDYTGVRDALRKIYKQGGIRDLWGGANIAMQRTMVGSATQLTAYDVAKTNVCKVTGLAESDIRVHVCSALFSAICIVIFMNPLDVVMTRSFNHRSGEPKVYSANLAAATWKVFRVEGFSGLYKGSMALFSRSAPHNIATFVSLEYLRKFRENYTNRSYTSGSKVDKSIGFRKFKEELDATNESSV
ncbi:putative mitochondrial mitochondrial carrier protein-like protein [Leptomonas pyrrhocoris]|uniref:Putative mitochondrial mitochondrial carrier protein-like protein n=1 Tax=Leptomonas pyrrhocoris TaxID=157538 RepID=A0A0N0DXL2_LEPPY|nr:putative mitochondrial mitochondrial carrier protein-like protein [Leptomonas pyrrhocoris]KPA83115.1 putative mitochondrial mitochondrial carrier protein-like protein [Leptomonas pyrrhocoris]|eukprot:XP_015661554.1 putative mitochondrial mitochondrial carrier protein-like protein [Leptomonas pyrrhocoris]